MNKDSPIRYPRSDPEYSRFRGSLFHPTRGLFLLLCLLGLEFISPRGEAFAAKVEILTPAPSATIVGRNPETHLVLRRPLGQAGELQVEVGGEMLRPRVIRQHQKNEYAHFRLPLKPGKNGFTILPADQRLELNYRPQRAKVTASMLTQDVHLFHRNDQLPESCAACHDLHKTAPVDPVGFAVHESCAVCHQNLLEKAKIQHSATENELCLTCHQQFTKPWRIGFPRNIEENCLACHTGKKNYQSRKHVHGPLNVGGCTLCHNPHGDEYRYQLWADGSVALCITCHSDKENLVAEEKPLPFVHGIIHGSGCVACHDPHAADHEFILHKPINQLCIGCHQGLAGVTRGHPVSGHPVSGPTERRRPKRELSCVSCHNPHGAPYMAMLIETSLGGKFCRECHK